MISHKKYNTSGIDDTTKSQPIKKIEHKHTVLLKTPPEVKRLASYTRYLVYTSEDIRETLGVEYLPQRKQKKLPLNRLKSKTVEKEKNMSSQHIISALEDMNWGNNDQQNNYSYEIAYAIIPPQTRGKYLQQYVHEIGTQLIHIVAGGTATLHSGTRQIDLKPGETILIPKSSKYVITHHKKRGRTERDLELLLIYYGPTGHTTKAVDDEQDSGQE